MELVGRVVGLMAHRTGVRFYSRFAVIITFVGASPQLSHADLSTLDAYSFLAAVTPTRRLRFRMHEGVLADGRTGPPPMYTASLDNTCLTPGTEGNGAGFEAPYCHGGDGGHDVCIIDGEPLSMYDPVDGVHKQIASVGIHGYGGAGAVLPNYSMTLPCWADGTSIDPRGLQEYLAMQAQAVRDRQLPAHPTRRAPGARPRPPTTGGSQTSRPPKQPHRSAQTTSACSSGEREVEEGSTSRNAAAAPADELRPLRDCRLRTERSLPQSGECKVPVGARYQACVPNAPDFGEADAAHSKLEKVSSLSLFQESPAALVTRLANVEQELEKAATREKDLEQQLDQANAQLKVTRSRTLTLTLTCLPLAVLYSLTNPLLPTRHPLNQGDQQQGSRPRCC
jgi:hypothetical protein